MIDEGGLGQRRPAVVVPAASASNHWDVVVLCEEDQVERPFLGKEAAVGEDVLRLEEDLGDAALQEVGDVGVAADQLRLEAVVEP